MSPSTAFVCPGQDLGPSTSNFVAGPGTTVHNDRIRSSLVGQRQTRKEGDNTEISVVRNSSKLGEESIGQSLNLLPEVGNIVLARVTRINRLQANTQILVVGETALAEDFQGIVRIADVRATEKDKVRIHTSFRPGDIIRAEVISLGDQSSYFLSTAQNELGVLFAWNDVGEMMYPASWNTMQTESGSAEERKVAKPFV
ncbi:Putative uncharacterized protein [Taphrina deformans PYCC 5710]|uniref:S1 motif domain-containing protein n=1 Tax=Taphrina deformans (strain PYCC 5710 / ATCC 11124 / CBS 356.35 / IMI 108563 / JCM 9778 / NBRC 8474) TaxID=1097556 RepID=R4XCS4_TAPDE|nr:Putative uncharacterized protein [Taphrina deformans PYCC 5710]|eukprot:CCG81115.1 Putative uncharacterized protein [Taphrina deformans PYCC 5710]